MMPQIDAGCIKRRISRIIGMRFLLALALRLNVIHGERGWYTSLELDDEGDFHYRKYHDDIEGDLWQAWRLTHDAYLEGDPRQAKKLCKAINKPYNSSTGSLDETKWNTGWDSIMFAPRITLRSHPGCLTWG